MPLSSSFEADPLTFQLLQTAIQLIYKTRSSTTHHTLATITSRTNSEEVLPIKDNDLFSIKSIQGGTFQSTTLNPDDLRTFKNEDLHWELDEINEINRDLSLWCDHIDSTPLKLDIFSCNTFNSDFTHTLLERWMFSFTPRKIEHILAQHLNQLTISDELNLTSSSSPSSSLLSTSAEITTATLKQQLLSSSSTTTTTTTTNNNNNVYSELHSSYLLKSLYFTLRSMPLYEHLKQLNHDHHQNPSSLPKIKYGVSQTCPPPLNFKLEDYEHLVKINFPPQETSKGTISLSVQFPNHPISTPLTNNTSIVIYPSRSCSKLNCHTTSLPIQKNTIPTTNNINNNSINNLKKLVSPSSAFQNINIQPTTSTTTTINNNNNLHLGSETSSILTTPTKNQYINPYTNSPSSSTTNNNNGSTNKQSTSPSSAPISIPKTPTKSSSSSSSNNGTSIITTPVKSIEIGRPGSTNKLISPNNGIHYPTQFPFEMTPPQFSPVHSNIFPFGASSGPGSGFFYPQPPSSSITSTPSSSINISKNINILNNNNNINNHHNQNNSFGAIPPFSPTNMLLSSSNGRFYSPVSPPSSPYRIGHRPLFGGGIPASPSSQDHSTMMMSFGSFQESILTGNMSNTPSTVLDGYLGDLGVSGKDYIPPHKKIPFSAVYYHIDHDTPYVANIDLGPKGYRVPSKGLIQFTIFNPFQTPIKTFLVNFDISGMTPESKTFIRQKIVSTNNNSNSTSTLSDKENILLKYAIHLRFICPKKKKYYLDKSIRVVFPNRVPDEMEKLKIIYDYPPEPRYFPYNFNH
eukprot:gene3322-4164_t